LVQFPEKFKFTQWFVQKINKPKFTNSEWEDIRIDFHDPIKPSATQFLYEIVKFLKINGNDGKLLEIKIQSIDQTGAIVEEWLIIVDKILTINFGDLDYNDETPQKPFLILKPLNCHLNI